MQGAFRLGLTGSIGMGKSAVAAMFRSCGVPVFDADAEVHRLQGPGGRLLPAIEARFPGTTGALGVDRAKLGTLVIGKAQAMAALEAIVHPAVRQSREIFLRRYRSRPMVLVDIPLLFETGADRDVDMTLVVSAPYAIQRRRVLARKGMTEARFRQILCKQMPDRDKRARADLIIETARPKWRTRAQIVYLIACVRAAQG
jgi:dephospho-CoA kinase